MSGHCQTNVARRAEQWLPTRMSRKSRAAPPSPFRYFNSSPEVIHLVVMMYVKYPLSLRNVEDLLAERGIDLCHETVRFWWNRFGPTFAAKIRRKRVDRMRAHTHWRWHLGEVFVKINGEKHYLWRAVDREGEILEVFATKIRDKAAALKFLKKMMKRHGNPKAIVTDKLRSYDAAMKEIGNAGVQETGRWPNNRAENSHQPFRRRERAMLALPTNAHTTEIQRRSCLGPQPFQPRTPPRRPRSLQSTTLRRAGAVAGSHRLTPGPVCHSCPYRRQVTGRLTAPASVLQPSANC